MFLRNSIYRAEKIAYNSGAGTHVSCVDANRACVAFGPAGPLDYPGKFFVWLTLVVKENIMRAQGNPDDVVVERDHCRKKKANRVDFVVERDKLKIKKAQQKSRPPHVK